MELEKAYIAKKYEDQIYEKWEKSGWFSPKIKKGKKPFTISMPPPNATGTLHLGHAIMLAIQDIMIRFNRMKDVPSLWVPGEDHASIATQNKVEQLLVKDGLNRHFLGREKFLQRVHEFVESSKDIIRKQIRKMGSSCDWTRERYTLDPGLSKAVSSVFVRMHKDGLIYRGDRIVNWCVRCASTLADDEVEYVEKKESLYYIKYGPFTLATVRLETKLGDTGLAVHPDDERYKKYVGQILTIEGVNGPFKVKVVADKVVDMDFGTGIIKVTPAHDFTDFEIAKRHNLPAISVIGPDGKMLKTAGRFTGLPVRECRQRMFETMQNMGLIVKVDENYMHNLSVCYRCETPIEPLISKQWFIDVNKKIPKREKSLKEMAIEAVKNGEVKVLPDRFTKIYFHWMENLRDWCISRQIWFGHRIPVWYCENSSCPPIVQTEPPKKCVQCDSKNLTQDQDTLDTWFSSSLWTFSTLGWPEKTKDLQYFHPTSVLETGYDILFFWVARMILMTKYVRNEVPFHTVYLHGLIRTKTGEKMSKSKPETCIDPLDMIEKYGADALRLSMIIGSGPGNDIRLYEEKIAGYRNFVNKVWNASRFALLNISEKDKTRKFTKDDIKTVADKWIVTGTQQVIKETTSYIENFQFSEAGLLLYDFIWNEYCAWYLEICKTAKNPAVLLYALKIILKLLHPFIPFATEVVWGKLGEKELLIAQPWPQYNKNLIFKNEADSMQTVIEAVTEIRRLRHENNVLPSKKIHALIFGTAEQIKLLEEKKEVIMKLALLSEIDFIIEKTALIDIVPESLSAYLKSGIEIYLPLKDLVNVSSEKARLEKEIEELKKYLSSLETKLKNPQFKEKAPAFLVKTEEEKLEKHLEKLRKMEEKLNVFHGIMERNK